MKWWALALLMLANCTRSAPESTPEGTVRLWLEHMEDSVSTPSTQREAYELLSQTSKKNLQARADRDAPRLGRRIQAHEMLAEGRFGLRFRPKTYRTVLAGARANVEVHGEPSELAIVSTVREGDRWRIELELPDVTQLSKRSDAGL
jgi:hypothetical protein